ncbi:two-component system regulatory protein YycI [Fructilactobacillus fructivorans]|uniref:Regulatory protein YycH-like domain-containing protein n=1 Tax=Fructilactobacillus fructivorans TaxID=1614 RepID=A0A0C1PRC1_9LACO|nr:two-component system regulatory protein YycI [Fructilactobacillus fructivorans]KID42431.1 hypothetical protein LfDm3_0360 [Fructilactobacillus fructivorans]MCT0150956.1 hypothetical protein [Fructilactobacillus fructivorans]MCT2867487.1 hypothetical protein [Fructilactobacillus fructivorans]MCT2868995.1 hypothetical protein [Fructilactobacillus fructivorans]MCT2873286.1 hypothetical protein [Fructilactobacillus fructivorans]
MNFKRIQEVFLLAFIILDVFLVLMIVQNRNMQSENTNQSSANATIIKEMRRDEISVGKLSNKRSSGYYISATNDGNLANEMGNLRNQDARFENGAVVSTLRTPVQFDDRNPQNTIDPLMKKKSFVINGDDYEYDPNQSNSSKIVYIQKAMTSTLMDNNAKITFNLDEDGDIKSYTQTALTNIKILHESAETISQERALIWLYQYNEIPNNSKVLWTRRSYTKLLTIKNNGVYIPTWVIAIQTRNSKDVSIRRINAFTGSVLKTENVQGNFKNKITSGMEDN